MRFPLTISNRVCLAWLFAGLAALPALRAAPTADPARLAAILGDTNAWNGVPADAQLTQKGTTAMLAPAAGQALALESKAPSDVPSEHILVCRLLPDKGATVSAVLHVACGTWPDKTPQSLAIGISAVEGTELVSYYAVLQRAQPVQLDGNLGLQAVKDRSLDWSEEMRRTIEAQMAQAPKMAEMTFTLRCTVEKSRFRTYLNGRFLYEIPLPPDMNPAGTVKVELSSGTALVSVRSRPLKPVDARFEPLMIDSFVNASTAGNIKVDRASFPAPGEVGVVDKVPFIFPAATAKGNDHLDVGPSWTRFGALKGYFDAASIGAFGGRWTAADRLDPCRFAMYVPAGRYKALHLISVSEGANQKVPLVTAQFYRPNAGHPYNFGTPIPDLSGKSTGPIFSMPIPVKTPDGKKLHLHHVVLPLDPDAFSWFTDLNRIGMELTKEVQYYRGYPDPLEYSWHGAGLPSSAHIYAMTLERADAEVDIVPDQFGHVWTAPATPKYTIQLKNLTGAPVSARLAIDTCSQDGQDKTHQEQTVALPADPTPVKVAVALKPTRYGKHELAVGLAAGKEQATYRRSFAYLHADTRERGGWEQGRGAIFGFWPWAGGHDTPTADKELPVMAAAGAETSTANYSLSPAEEKKLAENKTPDGVKELQRRKDLQALAKKLKYTAESAFGGGSMYYGGFYSWCTGAPTFDPAKPEASGQALVTALKTIKCEPGPVSHPTYLPFFAEPQIGTITTGVWPTNYGEEYQLNKDEQATLDDMKAKYLAGARACRKEWPKLKLLLPYGDPMVAEVFLRLVPESRDLIDGCALDLPGFERIPEQQINQVVLNRLYPILSEIRKYKKDPYLCLIEGTCISSKDIDTGELGQAEIGIRDFLVLIGYGVTLLESNNAPFDCANCWGENHYGGGWMTRLPLAMPKLAYTHYATLTRHINRANFTKYVPTGSTSVYCQQYKHYKTGKLVHVLWTIRGQRPVTVKAAAGAARELFDANDNVTPLKEKDGAVTFSVSSLPCYLEGLTADPEITLGESDHTDAKPSRESVRIACLGDGSWKVVEKPDAEYAKNKPYQIERFLTKMTGTSVDVSKAPGGPTPPGYTGAGRALAVHLEKPQKDRRLMPYYTTLEPRSTVEIPGKASHLGLWVKAASDWGRVVYVLRDARNEKWISVGTKEEWNCDDIHCWSAFCFDGWRYLRFQLPANAPYDCFREHGSSWWGSYGGDNIVDLPIKLEKILVERRSSVIYGNDLVPAKPDDVLLGDLYAEHASAADRSKEAVRLSKLRMPVPPAAEMTNPIAELAQTGVGAPTKVLKVADPSHQYDGTRCHVHFEPVAGAKSYDVWVGPYSDGRGAIKLGAAWTESGNLIEGLRPDMEFYVFVAYTDKDGKSSKPSGPLKFTLKDRFGYK